MRNIIPFSLMVLGLATVVVGVAITSPAAALIVGGTLVATLGFLAIDDGFDTKG